jgi:HEPN domain-containing protein
MKGGDPRDRWAEIARWLAVAENDRLAVLACMATAPPLRAIAAFHCQQAVEKLLKGFLVLGATRFRKTHSLAQLGAAAAAIFPETAGIIAAVEDWTMWAGAYRYPSPEGPSEPEPDDEELQRALEAIDELSAQLRSKEPREAGIAPRETP